MAKNFNKRDTFGVYLIGRYFGVGGFIIYFLWRFWQNRRKQSNY